MNSKEKVISGLYSLVGFLGTVHAGLAHYIYSDEAVANFMRGYQHDVTGTFGGYFLSKIFVEELSAELRAICAFGVASVAEVSQLFGLVPGTYDPNDFLAFAAGTAIAYGIDKLTFKNKIRRKRI